MSKLREAFVRKTGRFLAAKLPSPAVQSFIDYIMQYRSQQILNGVLPYFNRKPDLSTLPMDLPVNGPLEFEHLAGLFASSSLNHYIISMPIRQVAYIYGIVKQMKAKKIVEIGRYKGGATLVLAAAMGSEGQLWSIDIGEKVHRMYKGAPQNRYDDQIKEVLKRYGLHAELIIGNSRTLELDTGELDVAYIDGDHTYEGAKIDFDRFGRRVRVGGAVLFDDAFDEEYFKTHTDTVGRLVREIQAEGEFRLVKAVDRLAHLERVRPAANR